MLIIILVFNSQLSWLSQMSQVLPLWMQTASLSKPTLLKSCQRKVFLFLNNVKRVRWRDGWSVTWKRLSPAPLRDEDFRETRQNRKNKHPSIREIPPRRAHTRALEQISVDKTSQKISQRSSSELSCCLMFVYVGLIWGNSRLSVTEQHGVH